MRIENPKSTLLSWIQDGKRPIGLHVASTDPSVTDIAGLTGFDYVIIELEHGPMNLHDVANHARTAESAGIIPLVRLGENNANYIAKVLDVGCQGIIMPHVETAEEAQQLVSAVRFAPDGVRGQCPASHAAKFRGGTYTKIYTQHSQKETIVGVIIESPTGVDNAKEILAVDGIDFVLFGPGDLSFELGVSDELWDSPLIQDAWITVQNATSDAGKLLMGFSYLGDTNEGTAESALEQFSNGADFVTMNMDLLLLRNLLADIVSATKS